MTLRSLKLEIILLLMIFTSGFMISFGIFNQELILVQVEFEEVQEFFTYDIWLNDTNLDDYSIGELRCGYNSSAEQFYITVHPNDRIHNFTLCLFQKGYFMKHPVYIWGTIFDDLSFVNLHTTLSFTPIDKSSFYVKLTFWKLV